MSGPPICRATLRLPGSQISIVTSLASYHNPLSRMGGVEYVAEVGLDSFLNEPRLIDATQLFAECRGSQSGICSHVPKEILANIGKILHSVIVRAGLAIITFG